MSSDKNVDNAFNQLDGALCLWARAKGEQPAAEYFVKSTVNVRKLLLDGKVYQVVITSQDEDEEDPK